MSGTDFYYENMVELADKLAAITPGGIPRRVYFGNSGAEAIEAAMNLARYHTGRDKFIAFSEIGRRSDLKLAAIPPGGIPRRVYFGNSGAEAIEAAMKLARYHTGRDKFIAFSGAFHGPTLAALSPTGSKVVQRKGFGPLIPGVYHVQYPDSYRRPAGVTPEDHAVACVRFIEDELFRTLVAPQEVAAIVVEPIPGEGGYIIPHPAFFVELECLANKYDILLVFDEVQSGMGRTGKMWAADHFAAVPDI